MADINDQLSRPQGPEPELEVEPEPEPEPTADLPPGQALPGPHPHEAADIGYQAGLVSQRPDPMAGFREEDHT